MQIFFLLILKVNDIQQLKIKVPQKNSIWKPYFQMLIFRGSFSFSFLSPRVQHSLIGAMHTTSEFCVELNWVEFQFSWKKYRNVLLFQMNHFANRFDSKILFQWNPCNQKNCYYLLRLKFEIREKMIYCYR